MGKRKTQSHYQMFGKDTLDIIVRSMTVEQWYGACFFNAMKYRIRVGKKDDIRQEIDKAEDYEQIFYKYKHLCRVCDG